MANFNTEKNYTGPSVYRKGTFCIYIKCLIDISWKVMTFPGKLEVKKSGMSCCGRGIPKDNLQCQWGYQRQLCIIELLVRPFVFIVTH